MKYLILKVKPGGLSLGANIQPHQVTPATAFGSFLEHLWNEKGNWVILSTVVATRRIKQTLQLMLKPLGEENSFGPGVYSCACKEHAKDEDILLCVCEVILK